jgi:hypothetical protein
MSFPLVGNLSEITPLNPPLLRRQAYMHKNLYKAESGYSMLSIVTDENIQAL